ncbi:MAG: class I SAM-dependent methyltransferase [Planctomycetaceae bacterium]
MGDLTASDIGLLDPAVLRRLHEAPRLMEAVARGGDCGELHLQQELRRAFPGDLVPAALTLHQLRDRAVAKFSRARRMWFDRVGLEQSTAEAVADHKAERFRGQTDGIIGDLCCGIGADSVALAAGGNVLAVDSHSARMLMTQWNAEEYGVANRVATQLADVTALKELPALVHVDPDRRSASGRRSLRVEDCRPGLDFLTRLRQRCEGGAIKLSPASNFAGSFTDVEFELVSLHGECRECSVWFGSLGEAGVWRATALPSGETLAGNPLAGVSPVGPLRRFLYEPDPAIVRAGLTDLLAERHALHRLDAEEEYLTGDVRIDSPFVAGFEVLAELPNNDRAIRRRFRGGEFGQVEIKCRRVSVKPEDVRRKLPLTGSQPGVLIFARLAGKVRAVVARRLVGGESHPAEHRTATSDKKPARHP